MKNIIYIEEITIWYWTTACTEKVASSSLGMIYNWEEKQLLPYETAALIAILYWPTDQAILKTFVVISELQKS